MPDALLRATTYLFETSCLQTADIDTLNAFRFRHTKNLLSMQNSIFTFIQLGSSDVLGTRHG